MNRLSRDAGAINDGVVRIGGAGFACPPELQREECILIRPEDVEIGAPQPGWGLGTVQQRVFLGDRVQLRVEVREHSGLLVDATRDAAFRPGESVGLRVSPARFMSGSEVAT